MEGKTGWCRTFSRESVRTLFSSFLHTRNIRCCFKHRKGCVNILILHEACIRLTEYVNGKLWHIKRQKKRGKEKRDPGKDLRYFFYFVLFFSTRKAVCSNSECFDNSHYRLLSWWYSMAHGKYWDISFFFSWFFTHKNSYKITATLSSFFLQECGFLQLGFYYPRSRGRLSVDFRAMVCLSLRWNSRAMTEPWGEGGRAAQAKPVPRGCLSPERAPGRAFG